MESLKKTKPYIAYHLLYKLYLLKKLNKNEVIKTWSRSSTILPLMVNYTFNIYNGKKHVTLFITNELIGYKLGEFVITRKFISHNKLDRKIKKKYDNK